MARPTKLTPQLQERLCQRLRAGNYAEQAARSVGIAPSTYHAWLKRGRAAGERPKKADEPYAALVDAVEAALADAEIHAATVIRGAMSEDWRAAAWYLERRHPDRWRRRQTHELEGGDPDRPVAVELDVGSPQLTKAAHDFLRAAAGT